MLNNFHDLLKDLEKLADKNQAKNLQRFFKTGKGQYGEGDVFLGIKVPIQRQLVKEYSHLELEDIEKLLSSKIHEHRLSGLFILISKYKSANKEKNEKMKKDIFNLYLKNASLNRINNWDLVDLSAPNIVGSFLLENPSEKNILYKLSKSDNLWEKRISILATASFIRQNDFDDILKLSEFFINNGEKHDLMQKAIGWMLREVGKKDEKVLIDFLNENSRYKIMPRTMLRYSIEKFPENKRKKYLNGEI